MAKVHGFLEMWQAGQNVRVTLKESYTQNKQMAAGEYISDTEVIVKASWPNFQDEDVAAINVAETSSLPPALSAMDLPGGQTQVLNVHQIQWIDRPPAEI